MILVQSISLSLSVSLFLAEAYAATGNVKNSLVLPRSSTLLSGRLYIVAPQQLCAIALGVCMLIIK